MHHTAQLPALVTTPLARGTGQARWLPQAKERRRLAAAAARRLTLAAMMVAMFVLGSAVMVATAPTAEQTGQPLVAPPGLDL